MKRATKIKIKAITEKLSELVTLLEEAKADAEEELDTLDSESPKHTKLEEQVDLLEFLGASIDEALESAEEILA